MQWFDDGPVAKTDLVVEGVKYEGIQVVGETGYVIAPPSKLLPPDGRSYSVKHDVAPGVVPTRLKAAVGNGTGGKVKDIPQPTPAETWDTAWCDNKLKEVVEALRATVRGTYDDTAKFVVAIGGIVAGGGLDEDKAWEALSEAAGAPDKPADYLNKVRRAFDKGKERPWSPRRQTILWPDWDGRPLTMTNTITALENLDIELYYDEMCYRDMVVTPQFKAEISDRKSVELRKIIRDRFGFDPRTKCMDNAVIYTATQNPRHPFREYLESLEWNEEKRLTKLFPHYFGTADTLYNRVIGTYFIMSMVARAYQPGCKVDYMVILEGGQGDYKSQACRLLVSEEYFAENMPDLRKKDALEQLRGKVLIEFAEIVTLIRNDNEGLKAFITNQTDRFRASYGRFAEDFPRIPVFVGSTNKDRYIDDPTGARRFWPTTVGRVLLKEIARDRDQLFAEAVARFKRGRQWWPSKRLEIKHFLIEQKARQEYDDREHEIAKWIVRTALPIKGRPEASIRERWDAQMPRGFTVSEVWHGALKMKTDQPFGTGLQRHIAQCLRRLGCAQPKSDNPESKSKFKKEQGRRYWLPPEKADWLDDPEPPPEEADTPF
jgi:hypothetical protein